MNHIQKLLDVILMGLIAIILVTVAALFLSIAPNSGIDLKLIIKASCVAFGILSILYIKTNGISPISQIFQ